MVKNGRCVQENMQWKHGGIEKSVQICRCEEGRIFLDASIDRESIRKRWSVAYLADRLALEVQ